MALEKAGKPKGSITEQRKKLMSTLETLGFDPNEFLNKNGKLKVEEFTSAFNAQYSGANDVLSAILQYNKTGSKADLKEMNIQVGYASAFEKAEAKIAPVVEGYGRQGQELMAKAKQGNLSSQKLAFKLASEQSMQAYQPLSAELEDENLAMGYIRRALEAETKEELDKIGDELAAKGVSSETIQQLEEAHVTSKAMDASAGDAEALEFIRNQEDMKKIHDYVIEKGHMTELEWNKYETQASALETSEEAGEIMDEPIQMLMESIQRMYESKQLSEEEQSAWEAVREKMDGDREWVSRLDEPDMLSNHLSDELKGARSSGGALELQQIIAGVLKANRAQVEKVLNGNKKVRGAVVRALRKCAQ